MNFDGINDNLQINSIAGFTTGFSARTFEAWIRREDDGDNAIVFEYGSPLSTNAHWVVQINSTGQLELDINGSVKRWNTSLNDGQWHHIAVVHSGSSTLGGTSAYVDGITQAAVLSPITSFSTSNISTVSIGTQNPNATDYFDGDIDEVRFWSDARSLTEIQNNKDIQLTGSEANLVLYLNFNQGDPCDNNTGLSPVPDLAGGDNNANAIGFNLFGSLFCSSNYTIGAPVDGYVFENDYYDQPTQFDVFYPIGVTTVNWTYTNTEGSTATCTFDVTVKPGSCTNDDLSGRCDGEHDRRRLRCRCHP